ncbi:MAG: mycothiol synthase [Nocardioidaceae bacterium]
MTHTIAVSPLDAGTFDLTSASGAGARLRRVVAEATRADGREPLNEAALLELRDRGLAGSTLLEAGSGAGFAWVHGPEGEPEVDLVVDPAARGAGVGAALAEAVTAAFPGRLTAWSHGNHPAAAALAARHGLVRTRDLWVMRRPLDVPLPGLWEIDGVEVRTFEPGRDEDAWLAVNAAAFAHHPEQGRTTRADLDARMAEPWFDPAGFFLAVSRDDGRLLGFHWTKVHDDAHPHGEVYVVGVSPDAQGGGLGRLLTLTGLHHLDGLGLPEVVLYVEADNGPAIAVYSRLGFAHADEDTHVQYSRRVGATARP